MSGSRENSPDWLRAFQVPSHPVLNLSSDSETSRHNSPPENDASDLQRSSSCKVELEDDQDELISDTAAKPVSKKLSNKKPPKGKQKAGGQTPSKRRKIENPKKKGNGHSKNALEDSSDEKAAHNDSVWKLSSDSESHSDTEMKDQKSRELPAHESSDFHGEDKCDVGFVNSNRESVPMVESKGKSAKKHLKQTDHIPTEKQIAKSKKPKEEITGDYPEGKVKVDGGDMHPGDEGTCEKNVERRVTSSALPFVLPEKVQRSKALVECEGDAIDLSGDVGAVGRVIISGAASSGHEMLLDLKGTIYKTTIVPSRTFCVVSVGQSEAKVEAIMNDFIQLKPQSNVYDAETMVEGTLDGFSFDSEDEADKNKAVGRQDEENEDAEEPTNKKTKGKAEKKSGVAQKKGRAATGKHPKKRKTQTHKKGKTRK